MVAIYTLSCFVPRSDKFSTQMNEIIDPERTMTILSVGIPKETAAVMGLAYEGTFTWMQ